MTVFCYGGSKLGDGVFIHKPHGVIYLQFLQVYLFLTGTALGWGW